MEDWLLLGEGFAEVGNNLLRCESLEFVDALNCLAAGEKGMEAVSLGSVATHGRPRMAIYSVELRWM